jgi:hypothetical protein
MTLDKTAPLTTAWTQFIDFLKQHEIPFPDRGKPRDASPAGCRELHRRLRHFSDKHLDAPEHLQTVLIALSKGKHLVEAALAWEEPAAGANSTAASNGTSRARGEQWRLVMAYGGFETVRDALLPVQHRFPSYADQAQHFIQCCDLPAYELLLSPDRDCARLVEWLEAEVTLGKSAIISFLGLQNGDAKTFHRWIEGNAVDAWHIAIQLGKALRNVTAHGSLSASKVHQWGLREAFQRLTDNLGTIVAAALQHLGEARHEAAFIV